MAPPVVPTVSPTASAGLGFTRMTRTAWIHEDDEDVILFHDAPRNIYGAIKCGQFEITGRPDVLHVLALSYFAPPFCQERKRSVPKYCTTWDSRASYL